ncbi:MAG: type II toxin-antitoxin system HipA family toxin [Sideroxyarcus sp.]|nr:type II toxin-antitoxin system HipA family toxin [Sideroxyarcus sp.]
MQFDVYVNENKVGTLTQSDITNFSFEYDASANEQVSLLMPVSQKRYDLQFLHPVFQVSLPEGALRREIEIAFGKRMDAYGDMSILAVIGTSLIGRLSVVPSGRPLPPCGVMDSESITAVLKHGASADTVSNFVARHAQTSGVSGGYLKVLAKLHKDGVRVTGKVGRYIIKYSDEDHPFLGMNEHLSMTVAKNAGIDVPDTILSDDGNVVLVKRFDITSNGGRLGFEDMCSLLAVQSGQKFMGSAEAIVKTIKNYASPDNKASSLSAFFRQYVCACLMRNGDAHLKNFGMLYSTDGDARISPCYDMVSMAAYAPFKNNGEVDDMMALTLSGTKRWPRNKQLAQLGVMCGLGPTESAKIIDEIASAIHLGMDQIRASIEENPAFAEVGGRMLSLWQQGVDSIGFAPPPVASLGLTSSSA